MPYRRTENVVRRLAEREQTIVDAARSAAASGGTSKAKYTIADGLAEKTHAAANEILSANPLYPGLDVS